MIIALCVVRGVHSTLKAFKVARPVEETYIMVVRGDLVIIASNVIARVGVVGHVVRSISPCGAVDI